MLGVFGAYSLWTIMVALRQTDAATSPAAADTLGDDPTRQKGTMGWLMIAVCFVGRLVLMAFGCSLASDGASIALGVPAMIVGATIVSIGTTLFEIVAGVMAVREGRTEPAMGNAIGSRFFSTRRRSSALSGCSRRPA